MEPTEPEVRVAATEDALELDRWSLVLEAGAIPHRVEAQGQGGEIWVSPSLEARAREWLAEDVGEGAHNRERETLSREWTHFRFARPSALAFAAALIAGFNVRTEVVQRWILDGDALRAGDWWRPFTALILHADVGHLVSNLVIGTLAVGCVCGLLGPWLGGASVLLAGALGNAMSVALHATGYRSMGASTAIFGALGILSGVLTLGRRGLRAPVAYAPAGVGVILLGLFGLGAYPVDAGAHVTGFIAGAAAGALIGLRSSGHRTKTPTPLASPPTPPR